MKKISFLLFFVYILVGCRDINEESPLFTVASIEISGLSIPLVAPFQEQVPVDGAIMIRFSLPIDQTSIMDGIQLVHENSTVVPVNQTVSTDRTTVTLRSIGALQFGVLYTIRLSSQLRNSRGESFSSQQVSFRTLETAFSLSQLDIEGGISIGNQRIIDATIAFKASLTFSSPVDKQTATSAIELIGQGASALNFSFAEGDRVVHIQSLLPLPNLSRFELRIRNTLRSASGRTFTGAQRLFFTGRGGPIKFPLISDEALMDLVQRQTFTYFWDFAHPASGMIRERNTSGNLVTMGGSGFGVMAILVGIERGYISRAEGVERLGKIIHFLEKADRFHGAWPHWLDGNTGKTIPFSAKDDGGDLVETAFMIEGLLTAQAYLNATFFSEKVLIDKIQQLWEDVEWTWYTKGGERVLYWHWSPNFGWDMNLPIQGYNESLLVYILAAGSPTYPISKEVYDNGWARNGQMRNGNTFYQLLLPLGEDFGGPLFYSHYSFLGLDPRKLKDAYADYALQGKNHTLINRAHAIQNPRGFAGYYENSWGFTASDNHLGYSAHSPTNDLGVITPTAALSSFPYTPVESMEAMRFFYYELGDRIWGPFGFYDAFNITESWYANSYLAIDQGPILLMIENHRTALLWTYFMKNEDVKIGLSKLGFTY